MALSAVMALGMVACGDGGDEGGGPSGSKATGSISVHCFSGGFGNEVNKKLAADYKALTGVSVKYVPSYSAGEIQSLLNDGQEKNDIVMPLLNMYRAQDTKKLEDLSDVYDSKYDGETKTVGEKMNSTLYEYIRAEDGKRYQMFANNSVSAMCYNADTLDEAFGKGNWILPRTTKELFAMGDELKSKGYYTFSAAVGINYNWDYMGTVWWAQYDGYESYNKYYEGKYYDNGEWKLGTEIANTTGRKIALETLSAMLKKTNGYIHQKGERMGFEQAQAAFLGHGYVDDMKKCAFMVNGDWLENEMSSWLIQKPQNIGMMRAPVVSELADKLDSVDGEAKLAAIVQAVDEGKTELDGVTAEDFAFVKSARLMGYTATPNYPIAIPSYRPDSKKKLAKDYLVYLYSDRAQKIIASELQGLTYPTDYEPDESVNISGFVKSRRTAFGNDFVPIFPNNSSPVMYLGGLSDLSGASSPDSELYKGTTAKSIFDKAITSLEYAWNDILRSAGLA